MRGLSGNRALRTILLGAGMVLSVGLAGCQVDVGGQTLPSPYYMKDDVQYFPPGSQFKLSREAAAMKEYAAQQQGNPRQ
jgi:hypothetical protein